MIQNAVQTKYQKLKSKNFIELKLNENAFEIFENTFLLDKHYDILQTKKQNKQLDAKIETCLNLTNFVNNYNSCNKEKISEDIFLNGGFLLDIYQNRDYFVQDDIFEHNNEKYLLIHNKNNCNRINVIPEDNNNAQQVELKNLKQYMMINMGSVDNVGFFLNCECYFYNKGQVAKTIYNRLADISIVYKNQWYICLENDFEFDQIYAYDYYYEDGKKLYPYLNLKDSKILYYIDSTLTSNYVKRGCSLVVDGITYNTDTVEQVYYGRNTTISNIVLFPYGKTNNVVKTLSLQQKCICDTYKIPYCCLKTLLSLNTSSNNVIVYLNDKIQQHNDWAIQKCYYISEDVYIGKQKKLQSTIDRIKLYLIEENIVQIYDNITLQNDKILTKVIKQKQYIKNYFEGEQLSMKDEYYVLPKGNIVKYYQPLCENTDMNTALQSSVKKGYNKQQFAFNHKQNKWQKGK